MKRKWFRIFAKLIVISWAILSTFYISKAGTTYHWDWQESPNWGSWTWQPYYSGYDIRWAITDWWYEQNAAAIRSNAWKGFRLEWEGYKPDPQAYCDQMNAWFVNSSGLPNATWNRYNKCGRSDIYEVIYIWFNASQIQSNTYYHTDTRWRQTQNPTTGEVNYSLGCNLCANDDWLGKLVYGSNYSKSYTDPPGLAP